MSLQEFDKLYRNWVKSVTAAWHIEEPKDDYYAIVYNRISEDIQTRIVSGIKDGLIIPAGTEFSVYNQLESRGPYHWFSRNRAPEPCPNWEYFVQLVEFARLVSVLKDKRGYKVLFQDGTVDISVYKDKRLYVLTEIKESANQVQTLIQDIKKHEDSIDYTVSDKTDDSLRKAKYIVERRPQYFSLVASGAHLDFKVSYPSGKEFELESVKINWD
ncbi:MAG: hypothetical protein M1587_09525 [Thaumarchaeota archaeon]|nr:hypothetical protein [Nitrososphaerota archaeon]